MKCTAGNFDLVITEICIYLANGPRMGEFEYGTCRSCGLYGINNKNF